MPQVMGILNATPDSFYDRGAYFGLEKLVARAQEIAAEGADILDLGGAPSWPGAPIVEEEEELRRIVAAMEALRGNVAIPISIDSCKPKVVRAALERGAALINDIRGFQDAEMRELAASSSADLCLMHMQGSPQTMQLNPTYPEGIVEHLMRFFERQIELLVQAGVEESRIILDPGIGFGKTLEHTATIFRELKQFKSFNLRILIGASRKRFLTKILGKQPPELLHATLAVHALSLLRGADIVRAHDVKEHKELIRVVEACS